MRRTFLIVVLAGVVLLLSACVMLPPAPRTINVSEARLAQLISSQFPFNSTMLEVLDVGVSTPRIVLDPASNRINTSLDLDVAGGGILALLIKREYKGGIDLSYGLRFEPSDRSVRMTDVRVARLTVEGAPELLRRPLGRLGGVLAQELLNDYVLYQVSAEDLQATKGWSYKPGAVTIVPGGLAITLDPVERR